MSPQQLAGVSIAFTALTGEGSTSGGLLNKATEQGSGSEEPVLATTALPSPALPNALMEALGTCYELESKSDSGSEVSSLSPDVLASMLQGWSKPDSSASPSRADDLGKGTLDGQTKPELQTWVQAQQQPQCLEHQTADAGKPPLMPAVHKLEIRLVQCKLQRTMGFSSKRSQQQSAAEPDPIELLV